MHKIWPGRTHWEKCKNVNNSVLEGMSLASFCHSRAVRWTAANSQFPGNFSDLEPSGRLKWESSIPGECFKQEEEPSPGSPANYTCGEAGQGFKSEGESAAPHPDAETLTSIASQASLDVSSRVDQAVAASEFEGCSKATGISTAPSLYLKGEECERGKSDILSLFSKSTKLLVVHEYFIIFHDLLLKLSVFSEI